MTWHIYLFLTILFWGGYNILYRFTDGKIDFALLLCVIGITHAISAIPWMAHNYSKDEMILWSLNGVGVAVLMGILLTFGGITFTKAFTSGIPVSVATPAYSVGVMLLSAVVGVMLGEEVTLKWVAGMIFGAGSIFLLTTK